MYLADVATIPVCSNMGAAHNPSSQGGVEYRHLRGIEGIRCSAQSPAGVDPDSDPDAEGNQEQTDRQPLAPGDA